MRHLIGALLCALCLDASAGCRANDRWRGDDKLQHALAGAGIGWFVTLHTADPWKGFAWGAGVGAAKELILDTGGRGDCSLQDFVVTAIAAGVAAYTGGLVVTRIQGRTLVAYSTDF